VLRLLHLSDIHFETPRCLVERTDRDARIRDLILADALEKVEKHKKPFDVIVVTGDIAAKADPEEFEVAGEWLKKVAHTLGTEKENIFVVPGNHDVMRKIADSRPVKGIRDSILCKSNEIRNLEFERCLREVSSTKILMEPLEAYNNFAGNYGCTVWPPERAFWEELIPIDKFYQLRLIGLTSVFFSSSEDKKGNLYMGDIQTNFGNSPEIVNLVMSHHPTGWLDDGDEIADDFSRATIRLVGHQHRQRQLKDEAGVLFTAGAVNPSRLEVGGYEPAYNILDIMVDNGGEEPSLKIEAHLRKYQRAPEMFVAITAQDGGSFFQYEFPLDRAVVQIPPPLVEPVEIDVSASSEPIKVVQEMSQNNIPSSRAIFIRLWGLPSGLRRQIIDKLGHLSEDEWKLPDFERTRLALSYSEGHGKLVELIKEIEEKE